MSDLSDVAVIILNWKQADLTLNCLQSVYNLNYPTEHLNVVVVDNASGDGSVKKLREAYPDLTVIENTKNMGYAGGNNIGIWHVLDKGAGYILILNNDVVIAPDLLGKLLSPFSQLSQVAITTPLIADMMNPDHIWSLGAAVNYSNGYVERLHAGENITDLRSKDPFPVDVAPGSAMLIKTDILTLIGVMDEDYFLFYEEADWCMEFREKGFSIIAVPQAIIWHKGSASIGSGSPLTDYYMVRNRFRFIKRHWHDRRMNSVFIKALFMELRVIIGYTVNSSNKNRKNNRNARIQGLKDALCNHFGPRNTKSIIG